MFRQRESNPHFLPRHNDPVIEFPSQTPPPPPRSRLPPHHRQGRTTVEPPYGPRPQPPTHHPEPHLIKPIPPHQVAAPPPHPHQEPTTRFPFGPDSQPLDSHPSGRPHHLAQHNHTTNHHQGHHHPSFLRAPASRQTRPIAWLIAAFCALFWVIIIVGGLIILIVYLVFRPRSPRFDISTATLNAAYLDMGYLLNADLTVLANFTNPNTKVNVDFSYVILDLYYENNVIATRYVEPFSVMKRESRFADVQMVASQVRLSTGLSLELQKQMDDGRVKFEIKGLFRARSKLGGIFRYSYWMHVHCQILIGGPPTGVLIGKKCVTKR